MTLLVYPRKVAAKYSATLDTVVGTHVPSSAKLSLATMELFAQSRVPGAGTAVITHAPRNAENLVNWHALYR